MAIKLGVVMDAPETLYVEKDSTIAILQVAYRRGFKLCFMLPQNLFIRDGKTFASVQHIEISDEGETWYKVISEEIIPLASLDIILMRKDPPVDMHFIYATYLLEHAEREGVRVFNKPRSIRDANEKLFINEFPDCCPPYLAASNVDTIVSFLSEYSDVVIKPLNNMGGTDVIRVKEEDFDVEFTLNQITENGLRCVMVQKFIPEIFEGDKRILFVDGEVIPYALARIPRDGDFKGNLAAGGRFEPRELTDRDRWICAHVGPVLKEKGLLFVGIDVIGDYLTEINVTSPTCIRQFDALFGLDVGAMILDAVGFI